MKLGRYYNLIRILHLVIFGSVNWPRVPRPRNGLERLRRWGYTKNVIILVETVTGGTVDLMDTLKNDGLEKVTPFRHGHFWYVKSLGCNCCLCVKGYTDSGTASFCCSCQGNKNTLKVFPNRELFQLRFAQVVSFSETKS